MKLILCAGDRQKEGWVHHDVKPLKGIDIVCDLREIQTCVLPESCTDIEITHALEHFPTKDIVGILKTIRSLLTKNGSLYIEVPNFEWHAKILLNEGRDRDAVYYAFGGQEDEWDFHKTAFTPLILEWDLAEAGFTNIKVLNQSSLIATCNNQ